MKKVFKKEHLIGLSSYPEEVLRKLQEIISVLDEAYGTNRNIDSDLGGFAIVVEKKEDFEELEYKTYIDCSNVVAEYVDRVVCEYGEDYTNSLILCSSDYSISLIIPLKLTPQNLLDYIID